MFTDSNAPAQGDRKLSRKYYLFQRSAKGTTVDPNSATLSRSANKPDGAPLPTQGSTTSTNLADKVDKRQSRRSLFDLFSKPKVERARGCQESGPVDMPSRSQTPISYFRPPEYAKSVTPPRPSISSQSRPGSSQGGAPQSLLKDQETPWDPPPLFQAYPQSVKHGISPGLSASPESIERAQQYRNNPLIQDALGASSARPLAPVVEDDASFTSKQSSKRYSTLADTLNISQKHFVLVTTGRLLQYAGEGKSDRMPEKVLHLGPSSAAFVCDLIPGKHWVLQVMQHADGAEASNPRQSRSFISRLRFSGLTSRRNVSSLLMIFNGGEEMQAWMMAIRKAIQELGGAALTEPVPGKSERDIGLRRDPQLVKTPSHRYNVQRDPRAPSRLGSTAPSIMSSRSNEVDTLAEGREPNKLSPQALSTPLTPLTSSPRERRMSQALSMEGMSVGTNSLSSENIRLEQLREGSRHSLVSALSETDTRPTSRSSSGPPSPLAKDFPRFEDADPLETSNKLSRISVYGHVAHVPSIDSETTLRPVITPEQASISSDEVTPSEDLDQMTIVKKEADTDSSSTTVLRSEERTPSPRSGGLKIPMPPVPEDREDESAVFRPVSTVGQLPTIHVRSASNGYVRTRPFARPIPVKPSSMKPLPPITRSASDDSPLANSSISAHTDPRRGSSTSVHSADKTAPIAARPQRRTPSATFSLIPNVAPSPAKPPSPPQALQQALRRPNSVQIVPGRIPFLATPGPRHVRGESRSASVSPSPPVQRHSHQLPTPEEARRREAHLRRESFTQYMLAAQKARLANANATGPLLPPVTPAANPNLIGRTSMPAMSLHSLPPPMPPPTCPLPAPPTGAQAP